MTQQPYQRSGEEKAKKKKKKGTQQLIFARLSPTQLLIFRFKAYPWPSGREAESPHEKFRLVNHENYRNQAQGKWGHLGELDLLAVAAFE